MAIIKKYKKYRKTGRELMKKIIDVCLDHDVLLESAKLLGIAPNDIVVFENMNEINVLMDFALNEYKVNNKNAIQIYRETIGYKNEIEKDILDTLLLSYTSLFKIISIFEAENTLILNDILNKRDNIKLIDIALSKTAIPGLLMFIRLVPFKDFNITSGISFVFSGDLEAYLLRRYKKLSKKIKSDSESIKRFVSFFKLNRTDSIEVRYEEKDLD
ncbi:MAG: hypothetical protein DRG39_01085 [Deltaproteobacteria bacterium]|nr:MAG: hypothetical protein DRG39_01085 [Deltaproteobacteria bacterium]